MKFGLDRTKDKLIIQTTGLCQCTKSIMIVTLSEKNLDFSQADRPIDVIDFDNFSAETKEQLLLGLSDCVIAG